MRSIGILTARHIHMPAFSRTLQARRDRWHVAGIFEPQPAVAEKYAAELECPIAAAPDALLGDESIDAFIICGTTNEHRDLVPRAARTGKPLFVEKPLAANRADALAAFTAIRDGGAIFQTGHFMRGDPLIRFAKQEIDAGNLGTLTRVRHQNCHNGASAGYFDSDYRWFADPTEAGGGGFLDLGCHSLDILIHLFGPLSRVCAILGKMHLKYDLIDEYGQGMVQFKSGILGTLAAGWVDYASPIQLEISGTEGHLAIVSGQTFYRSKKTGADGKEPIKLEQMPPKLPHAFDLFLDVLEGTQSRDKLVPLNDALQVALAMDALYLSDRTGTWINV
jgi:predicted dehydrogenase